MLRLTLAFACLTYALYAADPPLRSVWDGVYTSPQADRGQSSYAYSCRRCHGEDLSGSGNVLRGGKFMEHWREDTLNSFFNTLKSTMPRGAAGSLADSEYVDIIAYVLQANEFPAGTTELSGRDLANIRIVTKDGPKPVPDFALITVVGCLAPGAAADTWILQKATEPVRTRNPRESTKEELDESAAKSPGNHTFRLLDTRNFPSQLHAGRRLEAKGFLIRNPGDDRINLTWLQTVEETCKQPR